ncbi:MAG: class I SAM-dependent methyltransferase [Ilumatobacteraceae bacterium]
MSSEGHTRVPYVSYGREVPGDDELRLCGDASNGKRALELGISSQFNALAFAAAGAKALAVDPDGERIARLREKAAEADVRIECHIGELADLEFATSGSVEVVLANGTLEVVDDLGRLLRQVHRVLVPSRSFVICLRHPFADVYQGEIATPYGSTTRTVEDWFTALGRANFRVDVMHELGVSERSPVPTTLLLRARKEGS